MILNDSNHIFSELDEIARRKRRRRKRRPFFVLFLSTLTAIGILIEGQNHRAVTLLESSHWDAKESSLDPTERARTAPPLEPLARRVKSGLTSGSTGTGLGGRDDLSQRKESNDLVQIPATQTSPVAPSSPADLAPPLAPQTGPPPLPVPLPLPGGDGPDTPPTDEESGEMPPTGEDDADTEPDTDPDTGSTPPDGETGPTPSPPPVPLPLPLPAPPPGPGAPPSGDGPDLPTGPNSPPDTGGIPPPLPPHPLPPQPLPPPPSPLPLPLPLPAPPPLPPAPLPGPGGSYYVQVHATPHEFSICEVWQTLKHAYPRLFAYAEQSVSRLDRDDGSVWFRLRIGTFGTKNAASSFCHRLTRDGHACFVVTNTAP